MTVTVSRWPSYPSAVSGRLKWGLQERVVGRDVWRGPLKMGFPTRRSAARACALATSLRVELAVVRQDPPGAGRTAPQMLVASEFQ